MAAECGDHSPDPKGGGDSGRPQVAEVLTHQPGGRRDPTLESQDSETNRLEKRPGRNSDDHVSISDKDRRRVFGTEAKLPLREPPPDKKNDDATTGSDGAPTDNNDTSIGQKPQPPQDKSTTDSLKVERTAETKPPDNKSPNPSRPAEPNSRRQTDNATNPYAAGFYDKNVADKNQPYTDKKSPDFTEIVGEPPGNFRAFSNLLGPMTKEQLKERGPVSHVDPEHYRLANYGNHIRVRRVDASSEAPKRTFNPNDEKFHNVEDPTLKKAIYSPEPEIKIHRKVADDPQLQALAQEYNDALNRKTAAAKERRLLTSVSSPERRERVENEHRKASRDLVVASEKLGMFAIKECALDQFGKDAKIDWINVKTGSLISEAEMINSAGGGPGRFDAVCIVTKKDGTAGVAYVVGEGKGGMQGHHLPDRWDTKRNFRVQQGTKEYFNTIIACMNKRGGPEAELAEHLATANMEERVKYLLGRGRLKDTPNGQMFICTSRRFDLSDKE